MKKADIEKMLEGMPPELAKSIKDAWGDNPPDSIKIIKIGGGSTIESLADALGAAVGLPKSKIEELSSAATKGTLVIDALKPFIEGQIEKHGRQDVTRAVLSYGAAMLEHDDLTTGFKKAMASILVGTAVEVANGDLKTLARLHSLVCDPAREALEKEGRL